MNLASNAKVKYITCYLIKVFVSSRWWGCWKTRNAQERNGTELEVIVVQYTDVDAGTTLVAQYRDT